MRKILATASMTAMILTQVVGIMAAENDTNVINSGSNATVTTTATENTNVGVTNNNTAYVYQTSVSENNTGGNTATGNISLSGTCSPCVGLGGGTTITTGNAVSETTQTVEANSNTTGIALPAGSQSSNNTGVVNTGTNLNVNTSSTTNTNVGVSNNNKAKVGQTSYSSNDTGNNDLSGNIGSGHGISTGNAGSSTNQEVDVNSNTTIIALGSEGCTINCGNQNLCDFGCPIECNGSNCTQVTNTGSNLNVYTDSTTNTNVGVSNNNYLRAYQTVLALNNTGNNTSTGNIGGMNGIMTGDAISVADQSVSGNSNETGIALWSMGLPLGGNMFSIVNTGANATTNATALTNTNVGTGNNNSLWAAQATLSFNSSGYNYSASNIGGSATSTGSAGAGAVQGVSGANSNSTVIGSWVVAFFPLFGLWLL